MDSSNEETSERSGADKKAKKRKSRKSSSGHTTPTLQDTETPNRRLTQEELDAQSKLAASRGRAVVATSPVVASETMEPASFTNLSNNSRDTNTNTNTAQVTSRDSIAKRAARRHGSGVATPGSVAFPNISPPGNEDNTRVALDIMESDLAVKSRARPSSNLYPTQQETATLNSTSLEDEEILEQKHGLDALEHDLAMKNISGARGFNSTVVDPSVRKLMTGSTSNPSIQQGDHEIKSMSIPSEGPRQEDFMFKGVAGEDDPDFKGPHEGGFLDEPGFDGPIGYGRPTPQDGFHHVSRDGDYPSTGFGPYGEVGGSGIEAFVAEQQVVDAMGVALVKSDEEQELIEKKRFRCALAIGLFVLIVLTVVIVVPVVIVLGKNEPKKTESPSASPSATPSAAPTTTRFQDILSFVRQFSANDPNVPNPLDDPASPQFLAADWVANDDLLQAELQSNVLVQRYILAVFYFSTVGDEWEECSRFTKCNVGFSWLDGDQSECLWHGVRCNANKQIEKILIGHQVPLGNNLKGTLPAELAQLTNMVSLVLIEGLIEGTIPSEYGQWSNLNTIFIQDHQLNGTIPEELIANGGGLEMLALGGNMLSGTIPKGLASMPELRDLQLVGNQFTGPIPAELGSLSNTLRNLELNLNQLTGKIPDSIYNLVLLKQLSLDSNKLSGTISSLVGKMALLEIFEVYDNRLTGNLPETIYTLPQLEVIRVSNNSLSGPLSSRITLLNQTLQEFSASNNSWTGTWNNSLFEALTGLRTLTLDGSQMTGAVSEALCMMKLRTLLVPPQVDCSIVTNCCG